MIGVRVFGPTRGEVDGVVRTAADMGGVKPRQILELLALQGGAAMAKDQLADLLWDGRPPASYVGTVESYVCVLRRSLCLGSGRHSALTTTSNGYRLDLDRVSVDRVTFGRLTAQAATAEPGRALALLEEAVGLVEGELLADEPYTTWAVQARECFRRELLAASVQAARLAFSLGDHATAVRMGRAAVAQDPTAEDAVQVLMRAVWQSGQRCEALRLYAEMRQRMLEELGDEPGPDSRGLYLTILQDAPAQPAAPAGQDLELTTLLRLVRQVLEATPGLRLGRSDAALTGAALLGVAGVA